MRNNNCELIRRELDELTLGEVCSADAAEHLRQCTECREFHDKQTKLRQIVGSLGTVSAPPDFDFRLRARLAGESSSAAYHLRPAYSLFATRALAFAALLLVFVTGAVLVRNIINRPATNNEVAQKAQPAAQPIANPGQPAAAPAQKGEQNVVATASDRRPQTIRNERPTTAGYKPKRPLTAVDFSNERAEVINGAEPVAVSAAFPIDASLQSFKVSLDDGRGNARTISVPPISFGSQRIVQRGNQFAPKRVW